MRGAIIGSPNKLSDDGLRNIWPEALPEETDFWKISLVADEQQHASTCLMVRGGHSLSANTAAIADREFESSVAAIPRQR